MTDKVKEKGRDLMYAWKKGWPSYIEEINNDYPAIIRAAEKCAKIAQVDIEEEEGYMRIKNGLANIAIFCSENIEYRKLTIFHIEIKLQNILMEMNAWRKSKASEKQKMMQDHMLYEEKQRLKIEEDKEREKARIKSLKWAIEEWDYIWEFSEQVAKKTNNQTCFTRKQSLEELEKKPKEYVDKIKSEVEEMKTRWRDEYKRSTYKIN